MDIEKTAREMTSYIIEVYEKDGAIVETIHCANADAVLVALDIHDLKEKKFSISRVQCIVDWS